MTDAPRVRHRGGGAGGGGSPSHNDNNVHSSHLPSASLSIDVSNGHSSGGEGGNNNSIVGNLLSSPKVHGRRAKRHDDLTRSNKQSFVLGGAIFVFAFCMLGVWMSTSSIKETTVSVNPVRQSGDRHPKDQPKEFNPRDGEFSDRIQHQREQMEVYKYNVAPPDEKSVQPKSAKVGKRSGFPRTFQRKRQEQQLVLSQMRTMDNDASVDGTQYPRKAELERSNNDMKKDDDDHISPEAALPTKDKPRVIRCDELMEHAASKSREKEEEDDFANKFSLSKVQRLRLYDDDEDRLSNRYVTIYPDDDDHLKRRSEVKKNSKKYRIHEREPLETGSCIAKHDWQIGAYPNCNTLHEFELGALSAMHGRVMRNNRNVREGDGGEQVRYWAHGYWRDVWLVAKTTRESTRVQEEEEITVLKTLRYTHDFTDRNYDRHRKDALASERLSKSINVVDIYAYCSNSAIFEYGDGGDIDGKLWPYDKKQKKHYVADLSSYEKIDLAFQIARAVADIHDVEEDGLASIAHSKNLYAISLG
eukprot:g9901.t1.1.5e17418a g9901  g9901.t1 contig4:833293-834958(+)